MSLYVRYGPPAPSEEPWRGVEVIANGKSSVDILALVKSDDVFGDVYPIVKVFTADANLGSVGGAMAEVGTISVSKLQPVTSFFVQRSGGSASDFTTVVPGPVRGPISVQGCTHRLRVFNERIDAFVAVSAVGPEGAETSLMLESVPLANVSPAVAKMFRYSDHVDHKLALDTHHTSTGHLVEASLHEEWSQSAIPSERGGLESGKWKGRIRKGVPSVHRHFILPSLLENCASAGRQSLEDALKWTYGWAPAPGFVPSFFPTFGAQYIESLKDSVPLLPSGWLQHKFILTCLAQQQPDISICPMLPAVVAYLLMVLRPNEAYVMASKMMQLSRRETVSTIRYLPLSDEATSSFVASAIRIASAEGLSKSGLEPEVLRILFEDLGVAFFSQTFPHLFTLRILDMFVYEGIKILVRVFVGILRVYLPTLGDRDLTQFLIGGPSVSNSLFNTCTKASFDAIIEEGFKISLSKNDISWSGTRPEPGAILARRELHHWPRLEGGPTASKILGTHLTFYEHIYAHFPISYSTVKRVFRASDDAWSVANLYSRMAGQNMSSAIILLHLSTDQRVGVFTSEMPWKVGRSYTGSRTDFLFVIDAEKSHDVRVYTCTNCVKENVLLCERDHLTAGQGPAFRLSGDMQTATSAACPTVFGSPRLWEDEGSVVEVEIFHIE